MPDPGCGAYARYLIHCSFDGFRLPCSGHLHERQASGQDVPGGIRVPVVFRAADTADPVTHIQLASALGAGTGMARAALLRGVALIHLVEPYSRVIAFVLQHGSERAPAAVQDGLGHPGLGQAGCTHVAHEDGAVVPHKLGAELVQEVFSAVGNLCVDRLYTPFLVRPLCYGQLGLGIAVELLCIDLGAVREARKVLEAQVDATAAVPVDAAGLATSTVTLRYQRPRESSQKLPERSV